MGEENRLVIVSNRLPIVLYKSNAKWLIKPSAGGLITALAPILKNRGGLWVGWPGVTKGMFKDDNLKEIIEKQTREIGYTLKPVILSQTEYKLYYKGFANEVIWPLFHGFLSLCNFNPKYWFSYEIVNKKFASVVAENIKPKDYIWIHDYHLFSVASYLRKINITNPIGFFLHIPFPPVDSFIKLPWRFDILKAMLEYDLVAFQTAKDKRNFLDATGYLIKNAAIYRRRSLATVVYNSKKISVGSFPISVDFKRFANDARKINVQENARKIAKMLPDRKLILGVDRLDYSKGLIQKFEAFRQLFVLYPELKGKLTLIQVVVPSRMDIEEYNKMKMDIEQTVGRINGEFTTFGWVPIYYMFRSLEREELIAYYLAADIALITSINDGMNLVAKEFCATKINDYGILILSEFAGAAAQLQKNCLLVNPLDINQVAETIYKAYNIDTDIRKTMMQKLRKSIKEYDIFFWVDTFLNTAFSKSLNDLMPYKEFYLTLEEQK